MRSRCEPVSSSARDRGDAIGARGSRPREHMPRDRAIARRPRTRWLRRPPPRTRRSQGARRGHYPVSGKSERIFLSRTQRPADPPPPARLRSNRTNRTLDPRLALQDGRSESVRPLKQKGERLALGQPAPLSIQTPARPGPDRGRETWGRASQLARRRRVAASAAKPTTPAVMSRSDPGSGTSRMSLLVNERPFGPLGPLLRMMKGCTS